MLTKQSWKAVNSVYFQNEWNLLRLILVFTTIILLPLAPTDTFSVNEQFTSKLHRVKIQTGTKLVVVCFHGILKRKYL